MANTPTDNFAWDKPAVGDRGWGVTWNNNLDAIDLDFSIEHRYGSGNDGKHGPQVTIVQPNDAEALIITKSGTGAGSAMTLANQGTGMGIAVTQTGAASDVCLWLQSNSTVANQGCVKFRSDGGSDVLDLENNSQGKTLVLV